ncbi:hypothetical protein QAD02_002015 [Eretmocerus hayati]|uniref:Uncharacterized protein n=1 Tax=Eretmocerus hayati TaxID=131215 RepID=A0ACC2NIK1_9HYME|nr:hypothetical protein QAD02_002015 [Eretmocerus hayati]
MSCCFWNLQQCQDGIRTSVGRSVGGHHHHAEAAEARHAAKLPPPIMKKLWMGRIRPANSQASVLGEHRQRDHIAPRDIYWTWIFGVCESPLKLSSSGPQVQFVDLITQE